MPERMFIYISRSDNCPVYVHTGIFKISSSLIKSQSLTSYFIKKKLGLTFSCTNGRQPAIPKILIQIICEDPYSLGISESECQDSSYQE